MLRDLVAWRDVVVEVVFPVKRAPRVLKSAWHPKAIKLTMSHFRASAVIIDSFTACGSITCIVSFHSRRTVATSHSQEAFPGRRCQAARRVCSAGLHKMSGKLTSARLSHSRSSPEKSFLPVFSCAWISSPTTSSQPSFVATAEVDCSRTEA